MPIVKCNCELKIEDKILRCRFRDEKGYCSLPEIEIEDEENAYPVCRTCEFREE
ncbi:unnamed protein product [marine sediment metagenome]|uniref:Uncharacterized protein n=1 Tax=marine sediment metagenome TaxID=412755 RepID=X1K7F5_9ZZZZ